MWYVDMQSQKKVIHKRIAFFVYMEFEPLLRLILIKKIYASLIHISFLATENVALRFAQWLVHPSHRLRYRTTPHLTETLPPAIFLFSFGALRVRAPSRFHCNKKDICIYDAYIFFWRPRRGSNPRPPA